MRHLFVVFSAAMLMNTEQSRCVANGLTDAIDWKAKNQAGVEPSELFNENVLTEQLAPNEIDAVIKSLDDCRGAGDVVLTIFETDGQMGQLQLGCFASQMTTQSAGDLLRLIIADDQTTFAGTEGEILLGVCGQGSG